MRIGTHGHRRLLPEKVNLRVVGNLFHKPALCKQKTGGKKACRYRLLRLQVYAVWKPRGLQLRNTVPCKRLERDRLRLARQYFQPSRFKGHGICTQQGLGCTGSRPQAFHHLDQLAVPAMYQAAVRIQLQKPVLALPELHDLCPRPAGAPAFAKIHVQHPDPRIVERKRRLRFLLAVLPADAEPDPFGMLRLAETVPHRRPQLQVAI